MTNRERQANLWSIGIGVLITLSVCGMHAAGWLDWLEYKTLDLRFTYANSIPRADDLVRIDIDDKSLEKVGRWPWPRYKQACLISIPASLGARAIVADIEYVDAEPAAINDPRIADGTFDPLTADGEHIDWLASDLEFHDALASAGNVYVAMHEDRSDLEAAGDFLRIVDQLATARDAGAYAAAVDAARRTIAHSPRLVGADTLERAQLVAALATPHPARGNQAASLPSTPTSAATASHFDTPPDQLAAALGMSPANVERYYSRCLVAAARRCVEQLLPVEDGVLRRSNASVCADLTPRITSDPPENATPRTEALTRAVAYVRGLRATNAGAYADTEQLGSAAMPMNAPQPIIYEVASAVRRCGLVTFETDSDKVTRRVPVLATTGDGRVFPQLAFACAADILEASRGKETPGISYDPARNVLTVANRELQLDEHRRALVPWASPSTAQDVERWHLPADAIYQAYEQRTQLEANRARIREMYEEYFSSELFPDHSEYAAERDRIRELRSQARRAALAGDAERARGISQQAAQIRRSLAAREQTMLQFVESEKRRIGELASGERSATDERRIGLIELFERDQARIVEPAQRANESLQNEYLRTIEIIRPRVAGKICIIGYTATALADMTPTPTSPRAPGVLAHYWLLNGLLTNSLVRWASPLQNMLITGVLGLLATLVAVWRGPRGALLTLPPIALLYVALAGWAAFFYWTYWFALVPPVLAMIGAVIFIAFHRYIFIERERRELATALAQYTSKAIARQVAENPELCRRAESREVTTIFTDVRGFTQIAERIGAQRTQRVLNASLERCTELLLRHEAMVNKFMGDGIFAFWNPVIYAQPDHARRACESAVDLQIGMAALAREQAAAGGDPVFAELVTRVGIATGNAVVGPCGSAMKYDYTCIGDSVNVAARLESANKFFGTLMLVNDETRKAVGDIFVFRPLGGVRVKGKAQPVQVFELLGRAESVPVADRAYADEFAAAVARFQAREFAAARAAFAECLARRPADLAAERYMAACATWQAAPPGPEWLGAIELDEK